MLKMEQRMECMNLGYRSPTPSPEREPVDKDKSCLNRDFRSAILEGLFQEDPTLHVADKRKMTKAQSDRAMDAAVLRRM